MKNNDYPTRNRRTARTAANFSALLTALAVAGCSDGSDAPGGDAAVQCADNNPLRNVYFGDLHVHSALSFDAYSFEVRNGPDDVYRFALGEALSMPPLNADGEGTQSLRLGRPLDFAAVTEHAEFLGEVAICIDPEAPGHDAELCNTYRNNGGLGQTLMGVQLLSTQPERDAGICASGARCRDAALSVWDDIIDSAQRFNDTSPACAFTTFVAYEYTANTGASALHRNVIFANATVPKPISYFDAPTPQGLWEGLQRDCIEAGNGCDVLAIPHNSNQSNGNAFAVRYPGATTVEEEGQQAAERAALEPLVEIFQHKGGSECSNGLAGIMGAEDEFCDFEKLRRPPFEDCGDDPGSGGVANAGCVSRLDFVRGALLEGLVEQDRIGANPYRLGVIGSTDTHNGAPGSVVEADWLGHRGTNDATLDARLGEGSFRGGPVFNPGGLAAVWAQENSRASLFAAMRRREVYGTSGPRMTARLFGGWDLPADLCADPNGLARANEAGVPMGGELPGRPAANAVPDFYVAAARDAGTESSPGTALQRIQIVKGWIEGGQRHQRVYDVAGNPNNGASVDAECNPTGPGFDNLCAVWSDPEFSADQQAFYYARVLENPSCRWTALQCDAAGSPPELASCQDPNLVRVIQERAWTSAIWYEVP